MASFSYEDMEIDKAVTRPEIPEYMVTNVDGRVNSALDTRGYKFEANEWVEEFPAQKPLNLDEIYSKCVSSQNNMIEEAGKLAKQRKLPPLDTKTIHTWNEVEDSMKAACALLETMSEENKGVPPGATGKLKKGFRKLCENAGAGSTLINLIPTESYGSVLCGGLKIIFTALQKTDHYRMEIYRTMEHLPVELEDCISMVEINKTDEGLHRHAASLFASLFSLMKIIFSWYLKNHVSTSLRMVVNPSGFSEELSSALSNVRQHSKNFISYQKILVFKHFEKVEKQNELLFRSNSHLANELGSIKNEMRSLKGVLMERVQPNPQQQALQGVTLVISDLDPPTHNSLQPRTITEEDPSPIARSMSCILNDYDYDPSLVTTDCAALIGTPPYRIDKERAAFIQSHPSLISFLSGSASRLLLINANSDSPATSMEASYVSAKLVDRMNQVAAEDEEEHEGETIRPVLIPLAFFCSRHRSFPYPHRGSKIHNDPAAKLALSLLFQLVDRYYRPHTSSSSSTPNIISQTLDNPSKPLDPNDLPAIFRALQRLISALPERAVVVLVVDGLRFLSPSSSCISLVQGLVRIFRKCTTTSPMKKEKRREKTTTTAATLKFLFVNSARADGGVERLFFSGAGGGVGEEQEKLTISRELPVGIGSEGIVVSGWKRPVGVGRSGEDDGYGSSEGSEGDSEEDEEDEEDYDDDENCSSSGDDEDY